MSTRRGSLPRCDALVLIGVQALVVAMPLALGGRETWAQASAGAVAIALLCAWLRKSRRLKEVSAGGATAAAVSALLAFSVIAIFQTIPLPPSAIAAISPGAHALFVRLLPGWPDSGGWASWRPLALEPFAGQAALLRFAPAFAVFAVLAAYPWGVGPDDREARRLVFRRLVATLLVSGSVIAAAALLQQSVGNGKLLWVFPHPYGPHAGSGRAHGPYVNPDRLAGYLEMLIPLAALCFIAIGGQVLTRLEHRTEVARHTIAARHRILMAALVGSQQRLIAPLIVLTALGVMLIAHEATDSRGGRVSLLIAALICMLGFALRGASAKDRMRVRRAGAAVLVALAIGGAFAARSVLGSAEKMTATQAIDPSFGARLLVVAQAMPLVGEFPLVGVGLGSWVHAFRLEQRPPIEQGRWLHAHNDYLEFAVETGLIGALILVWFAWAVTHAVRGAPVAREVSESRGGNLVPTPAAATRYRTERVDSRNDWMAVSHDWPLLRIGLAGGVGALLVHSLSDFHLQNPANTLIFMTLLGLLVLSAPTRAPGIGTRAWAPGGLIAIIVFAAAAPVFGLAPFTSSGAASARARIEDAYLARFAAEDAQVRDKAVLLARSAVELAPVEPDTHEMLARIVADEAEGDAAYRRAIWLSPDESQLRDVLAHRLWERGERAEALGELERSMAGAPYLAAHDYLGLGNGLEPKSPRGRLRTLTASDSLPARLRLLDPSIQSAIERGLRRALKEGDFIDYDTAVGDLATLLEANGRHTEAAAFLEEWAASSLGDDDHLRRAAVNYLTGGDFASAERILTDQLIRMPENGELYRLLAVDVYAGQEDFDTADIVLSTGQRRSADLLPIYRGMREVLTLRQYRARPSQVPRSSEANSSSSGKVGETVAAQGGRP